MEPISSVVTNVAEQYIDGKELRTTNEVLLSALELWGRYKNEYQQDLKRRLDAAHAEYETGQGVTLSSSDELKAYIDQVADEA